ncbi:MAG: hypothetical protein HY305_01885, partial [Sphingobacteriales bacterium]|nr:hypothetical protein [Sphingobacteriales bacterium]
MDTRSKKYYQKNKGTAPITDKNQIQSNPDKHIDQDFKGFPHAPATTEMITPATATEKATAAVNIKDGEKRN